MSDSDTDGAVEKAPVPFGKSVFDDDDDVYSSSEDDGAGATATATPVSEVVATQEPQVSTTPTATTDDVEDLSDLDEDVLGSGPAVRTLSSAADQGMERLLAHVRATAAAHRAATATAVAGTSSAGEDSLSAALRSSSGHAGAPRGGGPSSLTGALQKLKEELTAPEMSTALTIVNASDEAEEVLRRVVGAKIPQPPAGEAKKLRKLVYVDHSKIKYIPLRKDFFVTPLDVRALEDAEVRQLVKDLDGAKVRGTGAPRPLRTWDGCGLPDKVLEVLERKGFATPFAVQSLAVPALMSGRDLLVTAKTGSGKTLAYLLPLLRHVTSQPPGGPGEGPIGLVLVPTHELAAQVASVLRDFCKATGCRLVQSFGTIPLSANIRLCSRGCELMIATPGRLLDLLTVSGGSVLSLFRTSFVVVDEADRLFDSGFMEHVSAFLKNIRPDRQVALISATMPKDMRRTIMEHLHDPVEISVGGRPTPASNVEQTFFFFDEAIYEVDEEKRMQDERFVKLLEILGNETSNGENLALIFVNRKEESDSLFGRLTAAGYRGRIATLQSGMDQLDRQFALEQFKPGGQFILIATAVAERGLDIPYLELVVNYSLPDHFEGYVHRIGRTGRAGKKGKAASFFVRGVDDDIAGDLCEGLERAGQDVPEELYERAAMNREKRKSGLVRYNAGFQRGYQHAKRQRFTSRDQKETLREAAKAAGLEEYLTDSTASDSDSSDGDSDPEIQPLNKDDEVVGDGAPSNGRRHATGTELATYHGNRQLVLSAAEQENRVAAALQYAQKTTDVALEKNTTVVKFRAEYEINDLPERVRIRLQSAVMLRTIAEETHTTVVRKGIFFDPKLRHSHKLKEGERKLHLLLIGRTAEDVREAIKRLNAVRDEAKLKLSRKDGSSLGVQL